MSDLYCKDRCDNNNNFWIWIIIIAVVIIFLFNGGNVFGDSCC